MTAIETEGARAGDGIPGTKPVAWRHRTKGGHWVVTTDESDARYYTTHPAWDCEPLYAAPAAAPAWQPIETAPRDGTAILLGSRGGAWVGKWLPVFTSGYTPDNPWSSLMLNHDHMGEKWCRPTHWMPIPSAPIQAPATGDAA